VLQETSISGWVIDVATGKVSENRRVPSSIHRARSLTTRSLPPRSTRSFSFIQTVYHQRIECLKFSHNIESSTVQSDQKPRAVVKHHRLSIALRCSSQAPRHLLDEGLCLLPDEVELEHARLTRPVRTGKRAGTPRRSTVRLLEIRDLPERILVAKRNEQDAVVGEGGDRVEHRRFLTTVTPTTSVEAKKKGDDKRNAPARGAGGHKDAGVLAVVAAARPDAAGLVPERAPLCRVVAVARRDAEQERIVLEQLLRRDDRVRCETRDESLCETRSGKGSVPGLGGACIRPRTSSESVSAILRRRQC